MSEGQRQWVDTLGESHEHLKDVVAKARAVTDASYCSEWTIAQVLSHLGSGAEIGMLLLNAALAGEPAPERERYVAIWDVWNAKSPESQAEDALVSDATYIERWKSLSDSELSSLVVHMGARELDAEGFLAMRLFEHTMHAWDVEVMAEPTAALQRGATELLIDRVGERVDRAARGPKPNATPVRLSATTFTPSRSFGLVIEAESVFIDNNAGRDGTLDLPAGAFLRLVAGRLDDEHTPESVVVAGAVTLDELRTLFPGS